MKNLLLISLFFTFSFVAQAQNNIIPTEQAKELTDCDLQSAQILQKAQEQAQQIINNAQQQVNLAKLITNLRVTSELKLDWREVEIKQNDKKEWIIVDKPKEKK